MHIINLIFNQSTSLTSFSECYPLLKGMKKVHNRWKIFAWSTKNTYLKQNCRAGSLSAQTQNMYIPLLGTSNYFYVMLFTTHVMNCIIKINLDIQNCNLYN